MITIAASTIGKTAAILLIIQRKGAQRLSTTLPTGGALVVGHNLAHLLLKDRTEADGHRVDARLLVGVKLLRVAEDEAHVLAELRRRVVVVGEQLLLDGGQVH